MKKACILLLIIVYSLGICRCSVADEKQTDFLFIDGLSWSTPAEDYNSFFGSPSSVDRDDGGGIANMKFSDLELPGIDGTSSLEVFFLAEKPVMVVSFIDVNRGLIQSIFSTKMQDVYTALVNEGERIYAGRSEVLFESVEELSAVWEDRFDYSQYISAFLNSLSTPIGIFQDMYKTNDFSCISDAKAWLVDEQYGAAIMYSGKKTGDNTIPVVYFNMANAYENIGAYFASTAEDDPSTSRFGLPEGINWQDEKEDVKMKLGSLYLGDKETAIYAGFTRAELTGGYDSIGIFGFSDNRLSTIIYIVENADMLVYQDIIAMLKGELGDPIYSESTLRNAKQMSDTIEDAECWLTDDEMIQCAYDPVDSTVYVMSICYQALGI